MTNKEKAIKIFKLLEENHINLYHDVTKEMIDNCIKSVDWDSLNAVEFDCQMKKIFALFKDAHTSYFVSGNNIISSKIYFIQDEFYVKHNDKYKRIVKIGKFVKNEFYNNLAQLVNYETKEWLNHQIGMMVNLAYYHQMLENLEDNKLRLELESGETFYLDIVEKDKIYNDKKSEPFYTYSVLNGDILYVKYSACFDDKDNPFKDFVKQIKECIEKDDLKKYIIDVRDNKGGDSKIVKPLQETIVHNKMKGCVLMNNGTFSSGKLAVYHLKKHARSVLVGEATGGAIKSYGDVKFLNVENKRFSCSTKLFDLTKEFGYSGAILPDEYVPYTIDDLAFEKDSQLEETIKILNGKEMDISVKETEKEL